MFYCCGFVAFGYLLYIIKEHKYCCHSSLFAVIGIHKMAPLYFSKLIQTNYVTLFRMKWVWFVPNLVPLWSILVKLQSGPVMQGTRYMLSHVRLSVRPSVRLCGSVKTVVLLFYVL